MNLPKQIILASRSPRRKHLLEEIGIEFSIHPSDFEEKDADLSPQDIVLHNAIGKAQDVARHYKDALVIGVDTIGVVNEHILTKPKDKEDAKRLLRLLSNTTHRVLSGVCVIDADTKKMVTSIEETLVTIDRLEEDDIEGYVNSGEGEDKAASYAIQGKGALFIKKINGDYFNVVGLPIYKLKQILKEFGVKKWF
ncbi:MAG: Maf family protein [Candidatus Gracilibacteria bacterium]|jgi:septum formation protein